ncbi:MAG: hypothetical protein EP297_09580 [Gammaproteobacteria bacterium]|nr:MAG: hypothetical protein EP297_09580 [Gammaproteobacteria bacterium]
MKLATKQTGVIFIFMLLNMSTVQADYRENLPGISWFSSSTSSLLNRSSIELAAKHIRRGIRFAQKALQQELNLMDQLIANHNLCIGYLASDKEETADPYCFRVFELAQKPFLSIRWVRGAYRLSEIEEMSHLQTSVSPVHIVISNIQQHHLKTHLSLVKK